MSGAGASSIAALLRASSSDETTLTFPVPDAAFGFHAQQAIEKLMKALLVLKTGSHPFSHDLASLHKRLEKAGVRLPVFGFPIERLSEYAGNARYDEPLPLDEPTRKVLRECIAALRAFVLCQIP